jgi:hypothetical protein
VVGVAVAGADERQPVLRCRHIGFPGLGTDREFLLYQA